MFLTTGVLLMLAPLGGETAGDWAQFRGPNASGLAPDRARLPQGIGPKENLLWKTPVPPGHSSPAIAGDRIYLTASEGDDLLTLGIERSTGRILWKRKAPSNSREEIHSIGSRAQPSPAADAEQVVSLFGSYGLLAYDRDGSELWRKPLGPFKNNFGAGSSPILVGDRLILNQDHDTDSFLAALDKRTGKEIWRVDRSDFPRGYATPVIWESAGQQQIVVVGTLRTIAYDLKTGREVWSIGGMARIANMTPVVANGLLFIAAWAPGGDDDDRISVPTFDELIGQRDANKNQTLEAAELPEGPLKSRFGQIDRDKSGRITRAEYDSMRRVFESARNVMIAVGPGGSGDITNSHVLWSQRKGLPYVPSPVHHQGHLYLIRNGGILSSFDAKSGNALKQQRIFGGGNYYSSPVIGDGKLYAINERGDLTVLSAQPDFKELHRARFGEDCYATPALVGGRIYLRTNKHLYCFEEAKLKAQR